MALVDPESLLRKTVTVVFCDLVGSTALGERSDPEVLRETMRRYHVELRRMVEQHGGTIEKFVGDAAMAVFGIPQVHEDDAERAVRAALAMRAAVEPLGLQVRIGVNTGEVVTGTGETLVTGDAVNVAARLEQSAGTGEILVGDDTACLVRGSVRLEPVEPLTVKGKAEPLTAWRALDTGAEAGARRESHVPFVGRDEQLATLAGVLTTAADKRVPQLVTVVGPAGIGKSRLTREALARARTRAVAGRCLSYGDAITYWPLREIAAAWDLDAVLAQEPDADAVRARVGAAVDPAGAAASPDEIAWGFRRLLEVVGHDEPLVVVLDDIHWAEPTLLDLVEYVAGFAQDVPLVLLCTARAELFDHRPDWATPRPNTAVLRLEPLPGEQTLALVAGLGAVDSELALRIVETAEGNPLFAEQLVAMHQEADGPLEIPPSLQALIAARVDQLGPRERAVLACGAVEGRSFHRGAVAEMLPDTHRRELGGCLLGLVRRELIRPDRSLVPGDDAFRFGHVLVRDAAYESLPKRERATLHERFADWLAGRLDADAPAEIVGYHLEQAYRHRADLGDLDEALAERAAARLLTAAHAAELREDMLATAKLTERAVALLPVSSGARPRALVALGYALIDLGEFDHAGQVLTEAGSAVQELGEASITYLVRLAQAFLRVRREPERAADAAMAVADEALAAVGADEHELRAEAWYLASHVHGFHAQYARQAEATDRALHHARALGDRRLQLFIVRSGGVGLPIAYGPVSVTDGRARLARLLRDHGDAPTIQSMALHIEGHLKARVGQFDAAYREVGAWRDHMRDLGQELTYASTADCIWDVACLAGDWARGEAALREAAELLERVGDTAVLATHLAHLAMALLGQGRVDEALECSIRSEELGFEDDYLNEAAWRLARGSVLSARGDHEAAIPLLRRAVEIADGTDMTDLRGDVRLALARTLHAAGQSEASRVAAEALGLYELKGNEVRAAEARAFMAMAEAVSAG